MNSNTDAIELTRRLESLVPRKLGALFKEYGMDMTDVLAGLKWKPLVLVIGNYSSGKSTFINEVLGREVQRTGQAPTDDSFTVLAGASPEESGREIPGSTVIRDENLPFQPLRHFGESLMSHFTMKQVYSPVLEDIAIIDTPGMLDSVTEKDRGYDYLGVIGELAKLSDLVVLMFDPHKAGTIKETYQVIRSTLTGSAGEDRVRYVLNRIDECDNITDLLRAYGTLCWNLSQMTGRKDLPRIYLTYAPCDESRLPPGFEAWKGERDDLKKSLRSAPLLRLDHILQQVDTSVRELRIMVEALEKFRQGFLAQLKSSIKTWGLVVLIAFLFGDTFTHIVAGYPDVSFLGALLSGHVEPGNLVWPLIWALVAACAGIFWVQKVKFPAYTKKVLGSVDSLVKLDTTYSMDLWQRVKGRVRELIKTNPFQQVRTAHARNLEKIDVFLSSDLKKFFRELGRER